MQIIPLKDLQNASELSEICKNTDGPVFITKNGYNDMVVMNMETYQKKLAVLEVAQKLKEAEEELESGVKPIDARKALKQLRAKYGI